MFQDQALDPIELFGMGYPYYIKKAGEIIVFSSDEGVFVLRINSPQVEEIKVIDK